MGLFTKLFGTVEVGAKKIEEVIDDKLGLELHEVAIDKHEKNILAAEDKIDEAEAKSRTLKTKLEEYKAEASKLEGQLSETRARHDKEIEAGNKGEAEIELNIGRKIKSELDKVQMKIAPLEEQYEIYTTSIAENREYIEEQREEIERERIMLENLKQNEATLEIHRTQQKLSSGLAGSSLGSSSALAKRREKQDVEREKMRIQRERKKSSSQSVDDMIAERENKNNMPW